jgi:hypothetical protein
MKSIECSSTAPSHTMTPQVLGLARLLPAVTAGQPADVLSLSAGDYKGTAVTTAAAKPSASITTTRRCSAAGLVG